jgi:hypothetical protein
MGHRYPSPLGGSVRYSTAHRSERQQKPSLAYRRRTQARQWYRLRRGRRLELREGLISVPAARIVVATCAHGVGYEGASKDVNTEAETGKYVLAAAVCMAHAQRMARKTQARPGQLFIDRYMPSASAAERETAYENLRSLVAILVEIDDRIARESRERDSHESQV